MNLNKLLTPPCKGCLERRQMCHSFCDRYLNYKGNMQAVSDAREEYKTKRNMYAESTTRAKRQSY